MKVGGENVNKRMRERAITYPSRKKRNVDLTEGDVPDSAPPSSVHDEGGEQVQVDGYDPMPPNGEEIASVSNNRNVVYALDSSEKTLVLADGDVEKVSSHPKEEMLQLDYWDVPPIEISSDESDNEGDDVVIISDSEEEQEESFADQEQGTFAGEEQEDYFADEEQEESFADEEQEEFFAGEEEEQPENYEDSVYAAQLDLTVCENRRKLASLTALRSLVRLSREMTARARDFQVLHLIGMGAFGHVSVVRKRNGFDAGQVYAMKALSKIAAVNNLQAAKHVKSERQILEAVQGTPFVVCLHYAFHDSQYLYLVMNFAQGGDMYRRVQIHGGLPMRDVILYVGEMVLALQYLHDRNIIYRDLKLENILIDAEGHIVLADLGLATILTAQNEFRAYGYCGTLQYMAPEVVALKPEGYGKAVDWWSLGVTIVEMLAAISPFLNPDLPLDQQSADTERRIVHEEPLIPSELCPTAIDLVRRLLEKDPSRRINVSRIRRHCFFRDMHWTWLWERRYETSFLPRPNAADDVQYFDPEFTKMSGVLPDREPPPLEGLRVFQGFEYTSQQIIEWVRLVRDGSVEYCNPDVETLQSLAPVPDGLVLVERLQRGAFGTCFLTDQNLMVKVIHSSEFHAGEVDALSSLEHPNIVSYYGSYRKKAEIWIVTEHLSVGSLKWYLENFWLDERVSHHIIEQLANALSYVHSKHFIHGDLKPENVVCADFNTLHFKLVDFGNASYSSAFTQWEGRARYTLDYAPPELLASNGRAIYSRAVDVYCLGATLYFMVVGHPPFRYSVADVMNSRGIRQELRETITTARFNMNSQKWLTASQEFRNLVTACLAKDPADRPPIREITNCEWMQCSFHEQPGGAAVVGVQLQIKVQEVEANHNEENSAPPNLIARPYNVA